MRDQLLKLGYKPSAKRTANPRCICCNQPLALCGWTQQAQQAAIAARRMTWAKPKGGK